MTARWYRRAAPWWLLLFLVAVAGCSSGPRMTVPEGQRYGPQDLQRFAKETGPPALPMPEYRIGVGDHLDIVFLYHSNLSTRDLLVRPDGRISLPYVGDQAALGYTPMQLDSVLTAKFSEILREPNLSVIVRKPADKEIYVLGKVKKPGGYKYEAPVSILQSIALAGGFDRGAKPQHTVLIRRDGPEHIVGIEIDLDAIMSGKAVQRDIALRNYDIVFVPQSGLQTVADFAETVDKILRGPVSYVMYGWQIAYLQAYYDYIRTRNNVTP